MASKQRIASEPPAVQMRWARKRLDAWHKQCAAAGLRGWVILRALEGWQSDWAHELERKP